ncbi:MAG: TetR/AcrR family transcriptional regulator, partial [Bacteroidia bacterium]|nr:TetR/AcrR family transcriptional regulator [Bacteroidia bacterium]
MAKPKIDRKTLLRNSLSVFKTKGYNGTSMNDLAAANGLLKGSIYHYIESKEALMLEVLNALKDHYVSKVFSKVYDNNLSLLKRV